MINEDYVSFKIAQLLDEKGFDGEFHKHYWGYEHGKEFLTEGSFNPEYDYAAPTLQTVLKWLREIHHIEVAITYGIPFIDGKTVFRYFWYPVRVCGDHLEYPMDDPNTAEFAEKMANTYEDACEKAIKWILENLI